MKFDFEVKQILYFRKEIMSDFEMVRNLSFVFGFAFFVLGGNFWHKSHCDLKCLIRDEEEWRREKLGNCVSSEDKEKAEKKHFYLLRSAERQRKFFKVMCFTGLFIFIFGFLGLSELRKYI